MSLEALKNHQRAGKKVPNTRVYSLAREAMLQGQSRTKKGFEKKDVERFRPSKEKLPYWMAARAKLEHIHIGSLHKVCGLKWLSRQSPAWLFFESPAAGRQPPEILSPASMVFVIARGVFTCRNERFFLTWKSFEFLHAHVRRDPPWR